MAKKYLVQIEEAKRTTLHQHQVNEVRTRFISIMQ